MRIALPFPCSFAAALLWATLLGAAGCTEVGSDPSAAVAIELDPTALPSIVIGDSLRDSTGRAVPLTARAFNSQNKLIPDAPFRFLAIDTGVVEVDSITGFVVAKQFGKPARVVASVGGLQSDQITLTVTIRPDTVFADTATTQTMQLSLTSANASKSGRLKVYVGHDTVISGKDTTVGVPSYLVRYRIVSPTGDTVSLTDTSRVVLASDATGRPRTSAVTGSNGVATDIVVRISTAVRVIPDSVVVEASVSRPNATPLPGSPVRFVVRIVKGAVLRSSNSSEKP